MPYAPPVSHGSVNRMLESARPACEKIVGIDLFVESNQQPNVLADAIKAVLPASCTLTLISNRGTQVWPSGSVLTDCVNQYRVRVEVRPEGLVTRAEMLDVARRVCEQMPVCSTEMLTSYNETPAFSLAQGQ
jgi:isocitrate dehydrogenase